MSESVSQPNKARIELLNDGIWLSDFGLSVNTLHGAAPALFSSVSALRVHGRKRGLLAPEHTWMAAFPSARVPKAPAPLNREVRLGLFRVSWFAEPEKSPNAHIRIISDTLNCVLLAPDVPMNIESIFETLPEQPLTVVLGPMDGDRPGALSRLGEIAANWPDAAFVLYGRNVRDFGTDKAMLSFPDVQLLAPPEQDSLF
jgi:hypothetical protein